MVKEVRGPHEARLIGVALNKDLPGRRAIVKGPLDEEIIEDADSRHEQFTEESDRWRDDRPERA